LKVVDAGTSAKAAEMLAGGKADLAVVRGDTGGLSDARSVLLLTHGVVLIMAPSAVGADSLGDLRNTTIGVIGGAVNRPVIEALKQVYQFDRANVRFKDVAIGEGTVALSSGKVHALLRGEVVARAPFRKLARKGYARSDRGAMQNRTIERAPS
jgi:ABC-type amino acid transport substrate-binding protein